MSGEPASFLWLNGLNYTPFRHSLSRFSRVSNIKTKIGTDSICPIVMDRLQQDFFGVPLAFFRVEIEHAQKTPVKGIGATAVLPGVTIFVMAVSIF